MNIIIEPVTTIEECQDIEQISRLAWGADRLVAPDHVLIAIARNSGCVLLARDRDNDDKPVGFCFSFIAFGDNGALKHHSHQAAVIPAYQKRGVGAQIKWAQRQFIQWQEIQHVTWTFDPLESLNARLNLHKLGTVCNTYKRNVYGVGLDGLNTGMLTDRFRVDWWLNSERVRLCASGMPVPASAGEAVALNTAMLHNDILHPDTMTLEPLESAQNVLITIPNNIQTIKKVDLDVAHAWRLHTRELFESAFDKGFSAVNVIRKADCSDYILRRYKNTNF